MRLREEKEGKVSDGIYHRTQIDLTNNSNHIKDGTLTHEQTRYLSLNFVLNNQLLL